MKHICSESQSTNQQKNETEIEQNKGTGRTFQEKWKKLYPWIVYHNDKVFCSRCTTAVQNNIVLPQTTIVDKNTKNAFVVSGSPFHSAAVYANVAQKRSENIYNTLNTANSKQMKNSRAALLKIISSILYLTKQGLVIRGGHTGNNSNINQLLKLRSSDSIELDSWLSRTACKWTSHEVQNEIVGLLSQYVQTNLIHQIKDSKYFSIIMDETMDNTVEVPNLGQVGNLGHKCRFCLLS
ncbi:Uncharacterized protein FWK35_00024371 [Aphis craccivora]|uniref:Uncharacterized protein n=1 Tax=Aphis craccivora TaxID=307492 RepID=A0A6G0Y316_APHCR|nr:Uncharacterized protein FWK35_00024371 [Aphis craccivora]